MNSATFRKKYSALFDGSGKVKNYRKAFPLLVVAARTDILMPKTSSAIVMTTDMARLVTPELLFTGTKKLRKAVR